MHARRLSLLLALAVVLGLVAPLPAAADEPGPPVFGPESYTEVIGAEHPYVDPVTVECKPGAVVTSVPVSLNSGGYTSGAGVSCRSLSVGPDGVVLGPEELAGGVGKLSRGVDARSTCPADHVVVGVAGTNAHGSDVDSLQVYCRALNADGTLGGTVVPGNSVGKTKSTREGPYSCPEGAVATGFRGQADGHYYEYALHSFALRCQVLGFPSTRPEDINVTWPTALTVGATSTTTGRITAPGQDRWYRFPVQPGGRVTVTLTDLPADYDLTLFKDIEQAFTSLTSTEDLVKLSAEFAGDAYAPSVFSPSVFSPSVFSPSVFSPSVFSPSVFSPSVFSPSVFSPSVFSPSVFSPSVFSPSVFSPSVFSPAVSLPSVFSPSVFSPSVFSPSVFSEAFSSAQTRSVIGFSSRDGLADESLSSATWNNTGYFYVRVQGRNGASSADPFTLRVATIGGVCNAPLDSFDNLPTLTGTPGAETVILTDPARLPGTAAQKATLAGALDAFAGQVDGAVVDLGQSQRVRALQNQADDPDVITCPYAKNLVAEAAREIVNSYRGDGDTLKYVVVIGDDSVVPFFRYPDNAGLGPESGYAPPVADDTASEASLRSNYTLGQDAYGSLTDLSVKGTVVPLPDLPVGRLVESPVDITAALQRFTARQGAPLTPQSTLSTGYDFLTDAADRVAAEFAAGIPGGRHDTLITDPDVPPTTTTQGTPSRRTSWTATDLRNSLFGSRHDMVFLAGHFSANNTLAADYDTTVNSNEVTTAPAGTFADSLVFSVGCHSGYTVVDDEGIPGVTVGLDWTESFARAGATLIAGTGYQYGDTDFLEYSERLYADFARQLRVGTGAVPVGRALLEAKQNYLRSTPTLQGIDQKSVIEATLYGLPMLGVDLPGRIPDPTEPSIADPAAVATAPGSVLGLQSDDVELTTALTPAAKTLTNLDGGTVTARYLTGPDGLSVNPAEPALPLDVRNVTVPGQVLRGVALRSARYTDTDGITPLTGAPATETHSVHTPFVTPAFFPGRIAQVNYFDAVDGAVADGTTRLMVTPAQHRSDGPGSLTTTQRRYDDLGLRLFYSNNRTAYGPDGNVPALAAPPSITGVRTEVVDGAVNLTTSVVGNPAAGIQSVFVTYTGEPGSPFHGRWASLDLTQDPNRSTTWSGSLELPAGQDAADVRFQVQAVNGVGLVGIDDNQGTYFIPGVPVGENPAAGTAAELSLVAPIPTSGDYGDTVTVRARLTDEDGTGLAQRLVTFAVGGSSRTVFTDSTGLATAGVPLSVVPGVYPLTASYDGDETTRSASSAATDFTVRKQPTTLSLSLNGTTATATLRGADDLPLREKTVYFAYVDAAGAVLGGRTVITDWQGRADLSIAGRPAGATTLRAYFGSSSTPVPSGTVDLSDVSFAASGPVSVTLPTATPPVARDDSYTTPAGQVLTVPAPGVLGNDTARTTATLVSGPQNGQVTLRADGSFTFTPAAGFVGTTTFRYSAARDGQTSAPATVTITVTGTGPSTCTIRGTEGDDRLTGTNGNDVLCGLGGNDTVSGGNGNDTLIGGPGNDTLSGGNGKDTVTGGTGVDKVSGDNGNDDLDVRDGAPGDTADGGHGKDTAVSDPGDTVTAVP